MFYGLDSGSESSPAHFETFAYTITLTLGEVRLVRYSCLVKGLLNKNVAGMVGTDKTVEIDVAGVQENGSFSGTEKNNFCGHLFRSEEGLGYFLSPSALSFIEEFDIVPKYEKFVNILRLC